MNASSKKIRGLYLVIQHILPDEKIVSATDKALQGGVDLLQLSMPQKNIKLAKKLSELTKKYGKPFLVNNNLSLAKQVSADGVHFDKYEITPKRARQVLGENSLVGYTVGNDLDKVNWAEQTGADYVSFCSVFNSCFADKCQLVSVEKIKQAKNEKRLSIFAAGGITLDNAHQILEAGVDGIAVTSALLTTENPEKTAKAFKHLFQKHDTLK